MADEPTGNLDRTTPKRSADLLLELQQQEQTMMIVVTHSRELAAPDGNGQMKLERRSRIER